MKKKNKKLKKPISKNLRNILITVIILIPVFTGIIIAEIYKNRTTDAKLVDSREVIEQKIEEKQNTINDLENELNELKIRQEKLEKTIEEVKLSKLEKKTVTSRGSSSSKTTKSETVQASTTPITTNEKWIWANVSAYCACAKCCGKTNGITASGTKATANHTIAAPSNYKFGTKIEIAGMGIFTVEDRGGAITGNKIDIYFNSHSEALKFGRRQLQMRVIK